VPPDGPSPNADRLLWSLLGRLPELPGVTAAAGATHVPPIAGPGADVFVEGETAKAGLIEVTAGFFETLRTPIREGRPILPADRGRATAVVNEAFVRQFFNGASPLGRSVTVGSAAVEIVGVAADARYFNPREPSRPTIFRSTPTLWAGEFMVRTSGDPRALMGSLPEFLKQSGLRLMQAETLVESADRLLVQERMLADLAGGFGVLAIALASLGIFGVMSYAVTQRTREIGVRMALGATRVSVLWMVLRETLSLFAWGLAMGIPAILAYGRFVTSLLYDVRPADPATIAGAAALLAAVAVLAGYVPARRASRIAPVDALRQE
jgi:predicted permease